jgi:L-seryl-tRNA(Ser) seleniumtransferase
VDERNQRLRSLPSVDAVLGRPDVQALLAVHPRPLVVAAVRGAIEGRRQALARGQEPPGELDGTSLAALIATRLQPRLRRVLNATGVLLHTNLGRAPLSAEAAARVAEVAAGYSNLELDLETGERGSRQDLVRGLLLELTGAEAALVVNNCAAAVYLALRALAAGREVLVSRGELVEIGGSFRVPDVMAASGARLREVGTTNKTRLQDYADALGPEAAMVLKVHRSNFELVGFTEEVEPEALARLGRERGVLSMLDMGTASPLPPQTGPLAALPGLERALGAGLDLVCFSGDKLLGGPQCGILLGRPAALERLKKDPMARALRVDKLTLAALEATLAAYRGGLATARALPVVDMLWAEPDRLESRARELLQRLRAACGPAAAGAELVGSLAQVGGGSLPRLELASFAVALEPGPEGATGLSARLRAGDPAVLARVHEGRVWLDVRALLGPDALEELAGCVARAWGAAGR